MYTQRRNLNRGYMKLDVWNDAIELLALVRKMVSDIPDLDRRLDSQIIDATQSVSSNISEGYSRRSVNEYLYFLNVSLGSLSELMTRMVGLRRIGLLALDSFEVFDQFHYRVENKLLSLVKSLQSKRHSGTWETEIHEPKHLYIH